MDNFQLDARLVEDCILIGDFPMTRLLLMNDSNYPWFILVPRINGVEEVHELNERQQLQLSRETTHLGERLKELFQGEKMNVATLGNIVRQLHIHIIVRYSTDPAWPAPVWGRLPTIAYSPEEIERIVMQLKSVLAAPFEFSRH